MLSYASLDRILGSVPGPVVMRLSRIDTGRGREELFGNQLPALLTELASRARVASITASSALEGVIVADQVRASQIIDGKVATLRNRSEQEFAGYRAALDYLFTEDWRPLNVGLLLHLHRKLYEYTERTGGAFKEGDNLVVDRSPDGTVEVRFVPVPASKTEFYVTELVDRYADAVRQGSHHPVLLVGLFVLDLLTIHPFDDGNGRVVRAADKRTARRRRLRGRQVRVPGAAHRRERRCLLRGSAGLHARLARAGARRLAVADLLRLHARPGIRDLRASGGVWPGHRHQAGPGPRLRPQPCPDAVQDQ